MPKRVGKYISKNPVYMRGSSTTESGFVGRVIFFVENVLNIALALAELSLIMP